MRSNDLSPRSGGPDLFNHGNTGYNIAHRYEFHEAEEKGHEVYATRSIKAGEELFNSYNR